MLKTDAIIGGVHFFPDDAARDVARKALRVNLSDLAAKGATPLGFLLSLALPKEIGDDWLAGFAEGLRADAELFGCPLFGGDTDRTPGPITVSIAMIGSVPEGTHGAPRRRQAGRPRIRERHHRRCRARPGPAQRRVAGNSATRSASIWLSRYLLPQPRNALAEAVRSHASAAMDVSDGLAGDLAKLCRASQWRPTSKLRGCRCRMRPRRRSRPNRPCWRRR